MIGKAGLTSAASLLNSYVEGNQQARKDAIPHAPSEPTFVKMIVFDVINDPNNDLKDPLRRAYWSSWKISNAGSLLLTAPRNSIIAKRINDPSPPMFVLPFFPSHLAMPCKPGECVWVMFEYPERQSEAAYWFCRTTESHIADDVNHAHLGRIYEYSMMPPSTSDLVEQSETTPENLGWHELRNSPVKLTDTDRLSAGNNQILQGYPEDIFERLIQGTESSKLTVYESIPRFRKRPGDIVIEGSNNALISVGTDRKGSAIQYDLTSDGDKVAKYPDNDYKQNSGTVDIVAGRGSRESTSGKIASTTSIVDAKGLTTKGTEIKKEINKSLEVMSDSEGDPDLMHDRSRIMVSQRTKPDTNFGLKDYNAQFDVKDEDSGDAAIVIKTDKIRLIARSDVQIIVKSFSSGNSPDGQAIKLDEENPKKWASLTIRSNGDIVFTPSELGYIKLGGDDADLGIVCTDTPVQKSEGTTAGGPINTPMGGPFAATIPVGPGENQPVLPGYGKLASKVLIK